MSLRNWREKWDRIIAIIKEEVRQDAAEPQPAAGWVVTKKTPCCGVPYAKVHGDTSMSQCSKCGQHYSGDVGPILGSSFL
jgi:hypothetical protein